MYIAKMELVDFKCFEKAELEFSSGMNIIVGENNSGKSTVLQAIGLFQIGYESAFTPRHGSPNGRVSLTLRNTETRFFSQGVDGDGKDIRVTNHANGAFSLSHGGRPAQNNPNQPFLNVEPRNFLYPWLSRRKAYPANEDVRQGQVTSILSGYSNIAAKVDRLSSMAHGKSARFRGYCERVLGMPISAVSSPNGKKIGIPMDDFDSIAMEHMGEGIPSAGGLLAILTLANKQVLLIEEIENDLHPKALKALLEIIEERSVDNQIIITTHSNLVLKHLASAKNAKTFEVVTDRDKAIPTSSVTEVSNSFFERRRVLQSLGYTLNDLDVADGWILFEESSLERITRDFLVPWFAPGLAGRIRSVSTGGIDNVEPSFREFNRLFLFLYLEPQYRNRAWVLVDGDQKGRDIVGRLVQAYAANGEWSPVDLRHLKKIIWNAITQSDFRPARNLYSNCKIEIKRESERRRS